MLKAQDVLDFWFVEHGPKDWFGGKAEFDAALAERFAQIHPRVAKGEAFGWRGTADGRLAEIIVLDQFSRQLRRGSAQAFAQDPMALALAQEAIAQGADMAVDLVRRPFFYLPFMHSESAVIHEEALRLYIGLGDAEQLDYERKHRDVVLRFGRFPFRNQALGRTSTAEELDYVAEMGERGF